jgi:hypothetical protein
MAWQMSAARRSCSSPRHASGFGVKHFAYLRSRDDIEGRSPINRREGLPAAASSSISRINSDLVCLQL